MIPFKIGNWLINDDGIHWDGIPPIEYHISRERIAEPGPQGRGNMFDWLVHMPEKDWVTKEDTYSLNTAIVYAMEVFNISKPDNLSFVETLIEQAEILSRK